jgi:hypothetical protein
MGAKLLEVSRFEAEELIGLIEKEFEIDPRMLEFADYLREEFGMVTREREQRHLAGISQFP